MIGHIGGFLLRYPIASAICLGVIALAVLIASGRIDLARP